MKINIYICHDCQRETPRLEKPCKKCGGDRVEKKFYNHELGFVCRCKDCESERAAFKKQLDHPFYLAAEEFREGIKQETLLKASKKYKEPFNPESWTIEQLAKHAMAENYDQQNYIYGMYERLMSLEKELEFARNEAEFWRLRCAKDAAK